jgi:hypothetical protein
MILYIKSGFYEKQESWWLKFSDWANQQHRNDRSLNGFIEIQHQKLSQFGAKLKYERGTGMPYLEFKDSKQANWFLLKWS